MTPNNQEVNPKFKILFWERMLQIFLVAAAVIYALWSFGALQYLWSEYKRDPKPAVAVFILAFLIIFGYYLSLIFTNRKQIEENLVKRTPQQRYFSYLKIVLMWIVLIIINLIIH